MVEVWRHSQEEILRFKTMENGVLFAAGSCWEGVDFPGRYGVFPYHCETALCSAGSHQ